MPILPERKESPYMGVSGVGGGVGSNLIAAAAPDPTYVDDVFSADIYLGNGGLQQMNNGIDLAGEGGLVWFKRRNTADAHALFDSERGTDYMMKTNDNSGQATVGSWNVQFNSNGWQVNTADGQVNDNQSTYVAWTFRKHKGFFDIVKWTGNNVNGRAIPHNLGVRPGMIIIKRYSGGNEDWVVFHKGAGNGTYGNAGTYHLILNEANTRSTGQTIFNDTAPTADEFTVGNENKVNAQSQEYVAYLWADGSEAAAKIFGKDKDQAIVSCEAYEGSGSNSTPVDSNNSKDIGFEPQFSIIKSADGGSSWKMACSAMQYGRLMGGNNLNQTSNTMADALTVNADTNAAEGGGSRFTTYGKGFLMWFESGGSVNNQSETFCPLAIRMRDGLVGKPDLDASKYASAVEGDSTSPCFPHDFEVDMGIAKNQGSGNWLLGFRKSYMFKANMNDTTAPSPEPSMNFNGSSAQSGPVFNKSYFNDSYGTSYISYAFRRGPGFDVQIYGGDGSNNQPKQHSLGVVPELIAYRRWSSTEDWTIYNSRANNGTNAIQDSIQFNTNDGEFGFDTSGGQGPPTATTFYPGSHDRTGSSTHTYVALLWASVAGVSKIDQYTGTAATHNVSLGFAPKFIWIKRTDTSANWIVMSEAQGWSSSGNDTIGEFNNTNQFASNKNPVNPTATGFDVVGTDGDWNADGGTYLYYAHG